MGLTFKVFNIADGLPVADDNAGTDLQYHILGDTEVTANIYCKSCNLPNTITQINSTDLR